MNRLNKAGCGCAIAVLAALALAAGLLVWLWASLDLDGEPVPGWQEGPHTPEPSPTIHWTPFSTAPKASPPGTATP
ncbi:hypothetical protein [Actinomadura gamaensis]|uniref:Uncharacterized protein n=1 Tax=Actinomadura gamaensis TaxID=1763541 RepID=A0ABV9TWI1_9ACTN